MNILLNKNNNQQELFEQIKNKQLQNINLNISFGKLSAYTLLEREI